MIDKRLDEIIRLWPRLSDYWKNNLLQDAHEGIADGKRQADLDRKYRRKDCLVWPVYVTFADNERVVYVCPTRDRAEQALHEIETELPDVEEVEVGAKPIKDSIIYESWV